MTLEAMGKVGSHSQIRHGSPGACQRILKLFVKNLVLKKRLYWVGVSEVRRRQKFVCKDADDHSAD